MGIFGGSNREPKSSYHATVVANVCSLVGGMESSGDVVVSGKFEGIISSAGVVTIGEAGEVFGDIRAKSVVVSGMVDGVIDATEVHILSTGRVIGQMMYEKVSIEGDGFFDGKTVVKGNSLTSRYAQVHSRYQNFLETKQTSKEHIVVEG